MKIEPSELDLVLAQFITILSAISFYFGCKLFIKSNNAINFQYNNSFINKKQFYSTCLVLAPLLIYSHYLLFNQIIGNDLIEMGFENYTPININYSGYIVDSQYLILGLLFLMVFVYDFSKFSIFAVLLYIGFRMLVGYSRWSIIVLCFSLVILYSYRNKAKLINFNYFIFGIFLLIIFSLIGGDRKFFLNIIFPDVSERENEFDIIDKIFNSLDFGNFDFLVYLVKVIPDRTLTYSYGLQYLQVLTEPIPRALWSGKPAGVFYGFDLNDYGNFIALTTGLAGDGWISFGILGVIFTSFIWGAVLGRLYSKFIKGYSPNFYLIYIPIYSLTLLFYRDGSIVSSLKFIVYFIFPIYLVFIIKKFSFSK